MDYAVIYTSKTGNTEKIAMEIFASIPGKSKDIQKVEEVSCDAETYFVGFWNNRGTCSGVIMDFLTGLHGKRVALFGTCGMGGNHRYFDRVASQIAALIPDDNEYLGGFMCAGKMPTRVLEKYKLMQLQKDSPRIRAMIKGYEEAMLHPDEDDFQNARAFVKQLLEHEGEV